jgi:hypothetical protein
MVIIVVSLTSSEYHYSSFSELPYLPYFNSPSVFFISFLRRKNLCAFEILCVKSFLRSKNKTPPCLSRKTTYRRLGKCPFAYQNQNRSFSICVLVILWLKRLFEKKAISLQLEKKLPCHSSTLL